MQRKALVHPQACGYDAANCISFAVMETGNVRRQKNEYHADLQLILRHVVTAANCMSFAVMEKAI